MAITPCRQDTDNRQMNESELAALMAISPIGALVLYGVSMVLPVLLAAVNRRPRRHSLTGGRHEAPEPRVEDQDRHAA